MSPNKGQEYFSDGLAEELLNRLAKIQGLRVVARISSFQFKGKNEDLRTVGEKLNVGNILEGSVRKQGKKVRITAQLIKAADGFYLWSEYLPVEEAYRKAREAVERALTLDPNLAEAHAYMGSIKRGHDWDWVGADASFQRALALEPGNATVVQRAAAPRGTFETRAHARSSAHLMASSTGHSLVVAVLLPDAQSCGQQFVFLLFWF